MSAHKKIEGQHLHALTFLNVFGRTLNVAGDEAAATSKAEKTPEVKAREAAEFLEEDQWWKRWVSRHSLNFPLFSLTDRILRHETVSLRRNSGTFIDITSSVLSLAL